MRVYFLPPSVARFLRVFFLAISWNLLLRTPEILAFDFLNDDSALLLGAMSALKAGVLHTFFYSSYGPAVIRPFIMLSLAIQGKLWLAHPLFFYISGFVILSLGQAILWVALTRIVPAVSAWCSVLVIGSALLASEPTLWIADHHDIYLLFFISLSFSLTVMALQSNNRWGQIAIAAGLFLTLWGGFYCNEKGTVVPVLLVAGFLLLQLRASIDTTPVPLVILLKRTAIFSVSPVLSVLSYFVFRYHVLGVLVGGYDNAILPPEGVTLGFFVNWISALSRVPVLQVTLEKTQIAQLFSVPFVLAVVFMWLRAASGPANFCRRVSIVILLVGLLPISSLPTLKYNAPAVFLGLQNSRFFWLPHIISSIIWGSFFSAWLSMTKDRHIGKSVARYVPFLVLIPIVLGGRASSADFRAAHRLTRLAHKIFRDHCACADMNSPQTSGLPSLWRGVNVFTETAWLDAFAQLKGTPACAGMAFEQRCNVEFNAVIANELQYTPIKSSAEKLSDVAALVRERAKPFSILSFMEQDPSLSNGALLSGWVVDRSSGRPVSLLVLLENGEPVAFTRPNVQRDKIPGTNGRLASYGYSIPFKVSNDHRAHFELLALKRVRGTLHKTVLWQATL